MNVAPNLKTNFGACLTVQKFCLEVLELGKGRRKLFGGM